MTLFKLLVLLTVSWMIVLSGFVPRPFKYLSKAEVGATPRPRRGLPHIVLKLPHYCSRFYLFQILKVPIIARAMILAKHVFLRREDVLDAFEVSEKCIKLVSE